jgi:hypothetical protein
MILSPTQIDIGAEETCRFMREISNSLRLTVSDTRQTIKACRETMARADMVFSCQFTIATLPDPNSAVRGHEVE